MAKHLPIVAIVGRTNVGKSSLFNSVLRRREAIVANEPGTTRDKVTAKAGYQGSEFWLVDTAGIKDPADEFELSIQDQIMEAAEAADVIWVVIEAHIPITEEDRRVATMALKSRKPVFLIVNKADKAVRATAADYQGLGIKPIFMTSTIHHEGVADVLDELRQIIPKVAQREADNQLHIAILGRPNVGKSSLFNSLGQKQQALVASQAGTTRDINRTIIRYHQREIEIMDTAGIRRSGKIERGVEHFSVLRSLQAIEQADICLLLMDVNELGVQLDQKIAGLIKEAGKGLILVVSKWDSLEAKTPFSRDELAAQLQAEFDFVPWAPLIFTSAVTGQNVTDLYELALAIDQRRRQTLKTTELNRWLKAATDKHPPAGLKNRSPKLNYMVQETDNPIPSFKIFGAHTKYLHWSYRRYLERELREQWDYIGSPVQLWFIEKH